MCLKKVYRRLNSHTIQSPGKLSAQLQPSEMAMRTCHPKGFESEASKGVRFPFGGFFILRVIPCQQSFLSAKVSLNEHMFVSVRTRLSSHVTSIKGRR